MLRRNGRFHFKYINACACNPFFIQSLCQCFAVHNRAARSIQQDCVFLHQRDFLFTNQTLCFIIQRHMQGNDIAHLQHILQRQIFDACTLHLRLYGSAVRNNLAAESLCDFCNLAADGTCADNTEGFTEQLAANQTCLCAFLTANRITRRDISQNGDCQTECQFCNGICGIACRIADADAFFLAEIHINMVYTCECNGKQLQILAFFDNIFTEGLICDDNDIGILAAFCQLILILLLCVIRHNFMTSCLHCRGCFCQLFGCDTQGFDNNDFHWNKPPYWVCFFIVTAINFTV